MFGEQMVSGTKMYWNNRILSDIDIIDCCSMHLDNSLNGQCDSMDSFFHEEHLLAKEGIHLFRFKVDHRFNFLYSIRGRPTRDLHISYDGRKLFIQYILVHDDFGIFSASFLKQCTYLFLDEYVEEKLEELEIKYDRKRDN